MSNTVLPATVIVDPNRGYREWLISEIYAPGNASSQGQYVPNKDDSVRDWTLGILRVVSVDYTTGISILQKWSEPRDPGVVTDEDILLGAGPGTQSESYRTYLDQSVFPHTLACDARLRFYGTTTHSIKIFRGVDISNNGEVISQYYDSAGNLLGENIPLELVKEFRDGVVVPGEAITLANKAIKSPMVGHTTAKLTDYEVVTIVAYDVAGQPVSQAKTLIKNTAFVRQTDASLKYVAHISVETPFLLASDPHVIEYPINMPVDNLNLMGRVTYSDGSSLLMPVDSTKFTMAGLRNFVATIQGQTVDLMLSYQLSDGESAYLHSPSPNGKINVAYQARTKESDGAYSVKLFAYPIWVDQLNGYRLEYLLYNLDRKQVYRVTNLITQAANSAPFDPLLYNVKQRINVGVNMNQVDPLFDNWRHTQLFEITLIRPGNQNVGDNWTVGYTAGQDPAYGIKVKALSTFINVGNATLDISCGAETLEEWLNTVYYPTQPLYDARTETGPLVPNFFVLVSENNRIELPIGDWNKTITVERTPAEGKLVYIEFLRKMADNDLQLAVAGLITHQVPAT
ncbi:virion structural protein [Xanthomonas phage RTH11]|nr:virion structural protein [Xanthomonas phage RTH11]